MNAGADLRVLHGANQNYAWGSPTHIPHLRGDQSTGEPVAEAWFGAHPKAPSLLDDGRTLLELIEAAPLQQLGTSIEGGRLPYLMKLLAADEPLSIQVHPTVAQAVEGCAREDAAGIDRAAPNRSFRDDNHKPELIAALTDFEAMVGFRPVPETLDLFAAIDEPAASPILDALETGGLGAALEVILLMDATQASSIVTAVVAACAQVSGHWAAEAELLTRLDNKYPGDPGVLTAALLNRIVLAPGQAVYLGAGNLHAYVKGFGVEIMANSDNVLRGGLTPKHMDVPALLDVVDAVPYSPAILGNGADTPVTVYETPAPEFELTRYTAPTDAVRPLRGAEIVLSVESPTSVSASGETVVAAPGEAIWVPGSLDQITLRSNGLVMVASVGRS